MPNQITTICTVTGPDVGVQAFRAAHIHTDLVAGWLAFDFETIIPMPASVKEAESSSQADLGFYLVAGLELPYWGTQRLRNNYEYFGPTVPVGPLRAWMKEKHPAVIAQGEAAVRAFRETGHRDWYTWSIEAWGTKWNSYDFEERGAMPGVFVFKFETAWAFPEPVFRKLAGMHPDLVFRIVAYDEGDNFACEGEFNGANDYRTVKATPELYRAVYGEVPCRPTV